MNKKILLGSAFTLLAVAPVVAPVASAAEAKTTNAVTTKIDEGLLVDLETAKDQLEKAIEEAKNNADKKFFEEIASQLDALNVSVIKVRDTKKANEESAAKYAEALKAQEDVIAKQLENNTEVTELNSERNDLKAAKEATEAKKSEAETKKSEAETKKSEADNELDEDVATSKAGKLKSAKDTEYAYRVTNRNAEIKAIMAADATLTIAKAEEKYNEKLADLQDDVKDAQKEVTKEEEKLAKAKKDIKAAKATIAEKDALIAKQKAALAENKVVFDKAKETKTKLAADFTKAQTKVNKTAAAFLSNQRKYDKAVKDFNEKRDALELVYVENNREFNIDNIIADLDASLVDQAEKDSKANTWELKDGNWYYYNEKGELVTGWLKDGDHWYFFNEDNTMKTGWLKDGGHSYYLRSNGQMARGWEVVDGKYYMFKAWGPMAVNEWMPYGGQWYFLQADGIMATNTTINGWTVDATGAWV